MKEEIKNAKWLLGDEESIVDLRVFWQTIVQAGTRGEDDISVRKQGSLWGKVHVKGSTDPDSWIWRRYDVKNIDLELGKEVENHGNGVKSINGVLHFDGDSYLIIKDPGLSPFAIEWEIEGELSEFSEAVARQILIQGHNNLPPELLLLLGVNIRIEADIEVSNMPGGYPIFLRTSSWGNMFSAFVKNLPKDLVDTIKKDNPIPGADSDFSNLLQGTVSMRGFQSFPESPTSASLISSDQEAISRLKNAMMFSELYFGLEKNDQNQSLIQLRVSGTKYHTEPFELKKPSYHLLTIQQDGDRRIRPEKRHYFEFYVDALQLTEKENEHPGITTAQHYFTTSECIIYIGYDPITDINKPRYFEGNIRRLVFDPNASCLGCT